jgi:hypothetical protein
MHQCPHCEGFLPPQRQHQCPHCDARLKKGGSHSLKRVGQLFLGAGAALTLSACYGAPPPASLPPCDDTQQSDTQATPGDNPNTETPVKTPCVSSSPVETPPETSENTAETP